MSSAGGLRSGARPSLGFAQDRKTSQNARLEVTDFFPDLGALTFLRLCEWCANLATLSPPIERTSLRQPVHWGG